MNNILNNQNKELHISLSAPYKNLKKILGYEEVLVANSIYYNLTRQFRYSFNNINYSSWIELSDSALSSIVIKYGYDFWIEYKYTLNEIANNESIIFQTIKLDVFTYDQKYETVNCSTDCCPGTASIGNTCDPQKLFNPNSLKPMVNLYDNLSKAVSNLVGLEVDYYHTNPIQDTKDVVLSEYSVYKPVKMCKLKVVIPDNQLPTKQIQFSTNDGVSMPDMLEVHVVKSSFEEVFGTNERPRSRDYLYFPMMKKNYRVNSTVLSDDSPYNTSVFYKLNLTDYFESSDIYDEANLNASIKEMSTSFDEIFGKEFKDEMKNVAKPDEYLTIQKESNTSDDIRFYIAPEILIKSHKIINQNTYQLVSEFYYDFSNFKTNEKVITYDYTEGLTEDFSLTFFLKRLYDLKVDFINIQIKTISDALTTFSTSYNISGIVVETLGKHGLKVGDIISIKNSGQYNNTFLISLVVDEYRFVLNTEFKGSFGGMIFKNYTKEIVLKNSNHLEIGIVQDGFYTLIQNDFVYQPLTIVYDWYYYVVNFSNQFKQLGLFVYDKNFINVKQNVVTVEQKTFEKSNFDVYSGKFNLTNVRLFRTCVEEEQQVGLLSQYVLQDSHLALFIDNARPSIRLKKYGKIN